MKSYKVVIVEEENHQNDFLELPKTLYKKEFYTQMRAEEKQLILGTHVLSKNFKLTPFVIYSENKCIGRLAVTLYKDDKAGYIGFYECIDDIKASEKLLTAAEKYIINHKLSKIIGPVNASFWISYRMKSNNFDKVPYFAEPSNLPHYPKQWKAFGFIVSDYYYSNKYKKIPLKGYDDSSFKKRFQWFKEKGYVFSSPTSKTWDKDVKDIYRLITKLYSEFPVFKYISLDEYAEYYDSLKHILDFSMTKIAYYNGVAVGFTLGIPDYGNIFSNPGIKAYTKVFLKKIRSSRYISLYLGVEPEHRGLAKALMLTLMNRVQLLQADAIGALMHEKKINRSYASDLVTDEYEYLLFEKNLGKE